MTVIIHRIIVAVDVVVSSDDTATVTSSKLCAGTACFENGVVDSRIEDTDDFSRSVDAQVAGKGEVMDCRDIDDADHVVDEDLSFLFDVDSFNERILLQFLQSFCSYLCRDAVEGSIFSENFDTFFLLPSILVASDPCS